MEKERLEFRGGWGMAFIPLIVFFVFCVLLFLVFLSYDMHALAMGGFLGLIIGGMFVKNYSDYWKSVIAGIASPNSITIVVILFVIGMFSQMMKDSNASEGFVWVANSLNMTGGVFVAFVFYILLHHFHRNRFIYRNNVCRLSDIFSLRVQSLELIRHFLPVP